MRIFNLPHGNKRRIFSAKKLKIMETKMRQSFILVICALAICACSRSPAEQLAYQHAEEQYQINKENSARYRQSLEDGEEIVPAPIILTSAHSKN
jgi:hypothetical protein